MTRILSFKLLRSPNATKEISTKSRIYLNLYHFATGDTKNNSGIEVEFMIDPGSTCTVTNYPTYLASVKLEKNLLLQKFMIQKHKLIHQPECLVTQLFSLVLKETVYIQYSIKYLLLKNRDRT